jgi:hypothetical protein
MKTLNYPKYQLKDFVNVEGKKGKFIITKIIHKPDKTIQYQVKPAQSIFVSENQIQLFKNEQRD